MADTARCSALSRSTDPPAAGKSTVARRSGRSAGLAFLDTGACTGRLRSLRCARSRPHERAALADLVESLDGRAAAWNVCCWERKTSPIAIRGVDRSRAFAVRRRQSRRSRAADRSGSAKFAARDNVVTEGRDQGTLVFPDAFRKYYLTASDDERARRRRGRASCRGVKLVSFESVLEDDHVSATPATRPARSPR